MFSIGMYVKFRAENAKGEEKTILGQVEKELSDVAIVLCYERNSNSMMMKRTRIALKDLTHARIKNGSTCLIDGKTVRIIEKSKKVTKSGLYGYYCEFYGTKTVRLVSEAKIIADYESAAVTTVDLVKQELISNYSLWESRENISDYYTNSSLVMEGFDIAINSKIEMYEHQLETVRSIVSSRPYRAMLSDEVGLGKSIEALVVLKYAIRNGLVNRAIIVVPSQLVQQWRLEATSKFALDAQAFIYHSYVVQRKIPQVLIIGFDDYKKYAADYFEYSKWDFAIIDEAHKVIRDGKLYASIMKISKATENYLMLSATPILQRTEEYYNLLRLLFPSHYTSIGINKFNKVMKLREQIVNDVNYLSDNLRYYNEYNLFEDYVTRLKEINSVIEDVYLEELLAQMSEQEDNSYKVAYTAVNYLSATYEIDSKFIRHRRQAVLDPTTKRVLYDAIAIDSDLFDYGLGERDLKNQVISELDENITSGLIKVDKAMQICNALFSSIGALYGVITRNKLEKYFKTSFAVISRNADKEQFRLANSRLNTIVPVLKELIKTGDKIIVFSDYFESVSLIYDRLAKEFGEKKISKFTSELSPAGMQIAVNKFKHDKACQILVCDKSGGEGRNFQFAEYIIHYDMPWSPADVEQRIGRLDRIGRRHNHNVKNIVFYEKDSVEEDLFKLYNDSLRIFEESLCGIEIVFEDMNAAIKEHIERGVKIGFEDLSDTLCDLKQIAEDQISCENLSIMLQQSDDLYKNLEEDVMKHFNETSTKKFQDAIASWIELNDIGDFSSVSKPYRKANIHIYENEKHNNCEVEGTFFVKDALEYEDVDFLTCQHPIIRELSEEVIDSNDGRFSAVKVNDAGANWKGLILSWNLDLTIPDYYSGEWDQELLPLTNEFITNNRVKIVYPMNDSEEMLLEDVLKSIEVGMQDGSCEDLSRDEIEDLLDFSDLEEDLKKAIKVTKKEYAEQEKSNFVQALLDKKIEDMEFKCQLNAQMKVKNIYEEKKLELYHALNKAMIATNGVLDSVLFVCLEE